MIRRLLVLAVVFVALSASAAHAQYVPGQPGFFVDPETVEVCDAGANPQVVATGVGAPPSTTVTFTIDGQVVGSTVSNPDTDGGFESVLQIPTSLAAGDYIIVATAGNVRMTSGLNVTCASTAETTGTLPRTGSDTTGLLKVGLALLAAGGMLVLTTRKRRARV